MPPCLADPFADKTFNGILAHSSQITAGMHDKILTLPPDSTKIVVVGIGKSAIDLAGIYASLGRDVTVVFRNVPPRRPHLSKPGSMPRPDDPSSPFDRPRSSLTETRGRTLSSRLGTWVDSSGRDRL